MLSSQNEYSGPTHGAKLEVPIFTAANQRNQP